MSLDVSLILKKQTTKNGTGLFIRDSGQTRELTVEEVLVKFPDLKIEDCVYEDSDCVFSANITHNLNKMADAAGIYEACWRPEEIGATKAGDIIPILEKGFEDMKSRPEHYKQFDSENGWGTYKDFVPWVESYLSACLEFPEAIIEVSR